MTDSHRRRVVALIRAVSIAAAFGTTACSKTTPSSPVSPAPVDHNAIVAGTAWLHDAGGVRPYANVQMAAWVQAGMDGNGTGATGWLTAPISSGPNGRYSFTVPVGAFVRLYTDSLASYQPCVTATTATGNTNLDVHAIVDRAQLGAHLPSELLARTPTLSGTVFETTPSGRQPVPDVLVEVDMFAGLGDVSAQTLTDSDGRYVLCGLDGVAATVPSTSPYVWALKSGYQTAEVGKVVLNGNNTIATSSSGVRNSRLHARRSDPLELPDTTSAVVACTWQVHKRRTS